MSQPADTDKREPVVGYVHSVELPGLLNRLGISLLVSTYQAQRIMAFSANGEKLSMLMRTFERPTGMALNEAWLALCAKRQIWFLDGAHQLRDLNGVALPYDRCYVPRRSQVTGDFSGHEIAFLPQPSSAIKTTAPELLMVNTRFSCLSRISPDHSFTFDWKPPFIDAYVPEDRCHLNGLALDETGPRYVSALSTSNTKEGWRDQKASGGVILDIASGEVVSRGFAMPHCPRLYAGKLWVLDSGSGQLQTIDPRNGQRTTVAALNGYLRGLAFYDRFAFVGTCKIREKSTFGGVPIEARVNELKCGIQVIDLASGRSVALIEFTKGIEELFDIKVVPGVRKLHVIGFEEDTIDGIFVTP